LLVLGTLDTARRVPTALIIRFIYR